MIQYNLMSITEIERDCNEVMKRNERGIYRCVYIFVIKYWKDFERKVQYQGLN